MMYEGINRNFSVMMFANDMISSLFMCTGFSFTDFWNSNADKAQMMPKRMNK